MAGTIKRGESLFIPFQNGESIRDSQLRPRVYKTPAAYNKAFPKHYLSIDGIELVEYAEVVHACWIATNTFYDNDGNLNCVYRCSHCGSAITRYVCGNLDRHCHHCGANMAEEVSHENLG